MTKLSMNQDAGPQGNQTPADFNDLDRHGVTACHLELRSIGTAELAPQTG